MQEYDYEDYLRIANAIMFDLKNSGEHFTTEDFYREARKHQMPADLMKELWQKLLQDFRDVGYVKESEGALVGVAE